jgi:peptide/nickel transport system ATP-binding protein
MGKGDNVLLDVQRLSVDIPTAQGVLHAVQGISFSVDKGETLCIVGESGCGKSLTALALMDLLPRRAVRSADRLAFSGVDLQSLPADAMNKLRGEHMAMIFQEPMTSLNPVFTIGDQMTDVLRQHRPVSQREARERAVHLLTRVGIGKADQRLGQYPHQLSGGLRQRVMIAMALMCDPKLIIADEPTTALDVTVQAELLRLLMSLQDEFGMGLVLITHDLGIVSRMADRVAVMYAGQIVESGPTVSIFETPLHPYTQGLMACLPTPDRKRMHHLRAIPGTVPSLVGQLSGCRFRDRCPYAQPVCGNDITLRPYIHDQAYRCVLPPEVSLANAAVALEVSP